MAICHVVFIFADTDTFLLNFSYFTSLPVGAELSEISDSQILRVHFTLSNLSYALYIRIYFQTFYTCPTRFDFYYDSQHSLTSRHFVWPI
jgi:hypothetical protein